MKKLTKKQQKFVEEYLNTGNGVQSAIKAYDPTTYNAAKAIASENLTKPYIAKILEDAAQGAVIRIEELSKNALNEAVKLNANKDILDRAGYKPIERKDVTSDGKQINIVIPREIAEKNE